MLELSQEQVTRFTLKSHFLVDKAEQGDLVEVISSICGLNSQSARAPYISLRSRISDFKKAQLSSSLYEDKLLIKAWLMRGTVHTIPADDYPIYQKALGPGLADDWRISLEKRGLGLSMTAREKLGQKIVDILIEEPLTKKELLPHVKHLVKGFSEREQKIILSRTLRGLSYEGLVCHAEPTGPWYHFKENRFALTKRWLKGGQIVDISQTKARQKLAKKYLAAYGPARVADFAYWTGLKSAECKEIFAQIEHMLVEVKVSGADGTYWIPAEDADTLADTLESTNYPPRFLPEFDSLIMGHKDKSRILDEAYRKQVFLRLADVAPVFFVNGRVAGTWKHKMTDKSFELTPFEPLAKKELKEVEEEFARLRGFLEGE